LLDAYARLDALAITPVRVVNHGFTASLYYVDPDGNWLELFADTASEPMWSARAATWDADVDNSSESSDVYLHSEHGADRHTISIEADHR